MKFLLKAVCIGILGIASIMFWESSVYAVLDYPIAPGSTILTNKKSNVIGAEVEQSTNPLRDGANTAAKELGDTGDGDGIFYDKIDTTKEAWNEGGRFIKGLINYALGIAGAIALIYLLYHGFIALTAGADEEKLNKGINGMKTAGIAILGIGVAWFLASGVFRLITLLTT